MRRSPVGWADVLRRAEQWLLPSACLQCDEPLAAVRADEPLVCEVCRARWRPLPTPQCRRCGEPALLGLACRVCPEWPAGMDGVRSAVELDDVTRRVVHRLKYEGWPRLAAVMAIPMAGVAAELAAGADLVPIPVSRARRRRRGYNQAEALAEALGARLGRPVRPDRLARPGTAGSQVRLGRAARQANLASAFVAPPSGRPAVLVDDVFTTGATLVSAAAALLEAGADRVAAVTFARARPPLAGAADRLGTLIHTSTHETL